MADDQPKNPMRQSYRPLTDAEQRQIASVKGLGCEMVQLLHWIGGTDETGDELASRDLSLSRTHIEDAVMRAVRHITG